VKRSVNLCCGLRSMLAQASTLLACAYLIGYTPTLAGQQLTGPQDQTAASPAQSRPTGDWLTDHDLVGARRATFRGALIPAHVEEAGPVAGQVLPDACGFHFHLDPGQRALRAKITGPVRYTDDGGCEADFVVGIPVGNVRDVGRGDTLQHMIMELSPGGGGLPGDQSSATKGLRGSPRELIQGRADVIRLDAVRTEKMSLGTAVSVVKPLTAPSWQNGLGYLYEEVNDPVGITVNSLASYVNFSFTYGDYQGCPPDGGGTTVLSWYSPTGWFVASNSGSINNYCFSPCQPPAYVANIDYVSYGNYAFCATVSNPLGLPPGFTTANYWPQEVDGNWDGSVDGYSSLSIGGSWCAYLLSPTQITIIGGPV